MISSKLYDLLKFVAQILLPALGTFYFTLAGVWGLPAAEEVVATIVAVDTFLGVTLQLSSEKYKRKRRGTGKMNVRETADGMKYDLELDGDPEDLVNKDQVIFKIDGRKIG